MMIIVVTTLIFPRDTFMFYYVTVFWLYYIIVLYRISQLKKLA
jgi:O-antigen ligase